MKKKVGVDTPHTNLWDLHYRLDVGEIILVPRNSFKAGYVFYDVMDSNRSGKILTTRFNIYFRKPTQEEMVFLALRELDSEETYLHGEEQ